MQCYLSAQVFAEVVMGLGEAIVSGLVPGAALSFKAPKSALDKPEVKIVFASAACHQCRMRTSVQKCRKQHVSMWSVKSSSMLQARG